MDLHVVTEYRRGLKVNTEPIQHSNLYLILNSYGTGNTESLQYEDEVVNTVEWNNLCLL